MFSKKTWEQRDENFRVFKTEEMPARKEKNLGKNVSSEPLPGNGKRKQNELQSVRRRSILRGTAAGSHKHVTPFVLKASEKDLSELHVQVLQGDSEIGDPAEQLKAIKDIYPVISSLPGYIEKDQWELTNDPADVLRDLLIQLDKIGHVENWKLDSKNGKYFVSGLRTYGDEQACWIQANFLAKINRSHPDLHELALYAFMIVAKHNDVQLFGDWVKLKQYGGETYEHLEEDYNYQSEELEKDQLEKFESTKQYYGPTGIPAAYIKLMQGGAALKLFKQKLKLFHPKDAISNAIFPFLEKALELAETKTSILDYCEDPTGDGGVPPCDYKRVIWTWDDNDLMFYTHTTWIDSWYQGTGVMPFCWRDDFREETSMDVAHGFLDLVDEFFEAGNKMSNDLDKLLSDIPEQHPITKKRKKNV